MATVMNKRNVLSLEGKIKVMQQIKNEKKKKADWCREFGIVNSTIQTIWKNSTKIISVFE
jgi:hypothetical protein